MKQKVLTSQKSSAIIGLYMFLLYMVLWVIFMFILFYGYLWTNDVFDYKISDTLYSILYFCINPLAIFISAQIIKARFVNRNIISIIGFATFYLVLVQLLFVVRDFLITEIDGLPIYRDHLRSFNDKILMIIIYIFFSFIFLSNWLLKKVNSFLNEWWS